MNKTRKNESAKTVTYLDVIVRSKRPRTRSNHNSESNGNELVKEPLGIFERKILANEKGLNNLIYQNNSEKNVKTLKGIPYLNKIPKISQVRNSNETNEFYKDYNIPRDMQETSVTNFFENQLNMLKKIENDYKNDHDNILEVKKNGDLALNGFKKCVKYTSDQVNIQKKTLEKINDIRKKTNEIIK